MIEVRKMTNWQVCGTIIIFVLSMAATAIFGCDEY